MLGSGLSQDYLSDFFRQNFHAHKVHGTKGLSHPFSNRAQHGAEFDSKRFVPKHHWIMNQRE